MAYGYIQSEAKFAAWLQSALRRVWSKHPSKLGLIQKRQVKLKSGVKMIYHFRCEHCKQLFKMKECEVNHKKKCGGLSDLSKFNEFANNLLLVKEEDLELLCHDCHGIVTYMERYDVSKRDALIEKKVIAFTKESDSVQIAKCKLAKIDPVPKTKIGRKKAVREYLQRVMPQ